VAVAVAVADAEELAISVSIGTTGAIGFITGLTTGTLPIATELDALDALDVVTVVLCSIGPYPKLPQRGILDKYEPILENAEGKAMPLTPVLIR